MEMTTKKLNTDHLNAMVSALNKTKAFTVTVDEEIHTVIAKHNKTGDEVYKAVRRGDEDVWDITHRKDLFR